MPVSNIAILTLAPVYPFAQRSSAPNIEVTCDLCQNPKTTKHATAHFQLINPNIAVMSTKLMLYVKIDFQVE